MEITEEIIKIIYERAIQFSIAKYGNKPDFLKLYNDNITAIWDIGCCGSYEEEEKEIYPLDLTANLDEISEKRRELERIENIKREEYNKKRDEEQKKAQKRDRKEQYLKLKKEFEDGI